MDRDTYLRSSLGPWSSHPKFVALRARYACMLATLPLTILVTLFAIRVRKAASWLELLNSIGTWLSVAAVLLSFAVSGIVTIALMSRLNRWQHVSKSWSLDLKGGFADDKRGRPRVALDWWILLPSIVIGFVGPFFASRYLSTADTQSSALFAAWALRSLALFPLFALLAITGVGGDIVADPTLERKRRPWLLLISGFFAFGAVVTGLRDVSVLSKNDQLTALVDRYLPNIQFAPPLAVAAGFAVVSVLAFVAWRLWTTNATSLESKARSMMAPGRLASLLKELGDNKTRDVAAIPPWLEQLFGKLIASDAVESPSASSLVWLFARPTSQRASLSLQVAIDAIGKLIDPDHPVRDHSAADSVVTEDDSASGLELQIALAVYIVLIRGQRVLWMIPDADDRQEIQQAVDRSLSRISVGGLIRAGFVTSTTASDFANDASTVPAILLATPEYWNDFVWTNTTLDVATRLQLIQAIHLISLRDPEAFTASQAESMVGQTLSHRILNATVGSYTQVVVHSTAAKQTEAEAFLERVRSIAAPPSAATMVSGYLQDYLPELTPLYPKTEATRKQLSNCRGIRTDSIPPQHPIEPSVYRIKN